MAEASSSYVAPTTTTTVVTLRNEKVCKPEHCNGVHINNIVFHLQCLDPTPDPTAYYSSYKINLDRPVSVKSVFDALDDDDQCLRTACFAHSLERIFYSEIRTKVVQQANYLYRAEDEILLTVFVNKPDIFPEEMYPLSTARAMYKEFSNAIKNRPDPTLHIWIRYRGYRDHNITDVYKKVLITTFRYRYQKQPKEAFNKLYSYCNDLLLFTVDNFDTTYRICNIAQTL